MTNFEKFKNLSEEELASYLFELQMGIIEVPYCKENECGECDYLRNLGREIPEAMCKECVKKWLQKIAEEG